MRRHQDHVEIELVEALFVLRTIDRAQPGVDADAGEVLDVRLEDALQVRIDQQDLQAQGLSGGVLQALAVQLPAGFGEQPRALRRVSRGMPAPSVCGRLKGSVKSFAGNCSRQGLSISHSWPTGRPVAENSLLG